MLPDAWPSGLQTAEAEVRSVSDALANATTPGFQPEEEMPVSGPYEVVFPGSWPAQGAVVPQPVATGQGAEDGVPVLDTAPEAVTPGASPTDLALTVPGWFVLRTPQGLALTRDGAFQRDAAGRLVAPGGGVLLGLDMRPVRVPVSGWSIRNGAVVSGGRVLARLAYATVPDPSGLVRVSGGLFVTTPASGPMAVVPAVGSDVVQGALDASGTDMVLELVQAVAAQAQFDTSAEAGRVAAEMAQAAAQIPPEG